MTSIKVSNASVEIPIYDVSARRSLKKVAMHLSVGGRLGSDAGHPVVVKALSNINLNLTTGDRLGLLGHNGAGKSTLLRVLAGIYEPTGGTVEVTGKVASLFDLGLGFNPRRPATTTSALAASISACRCERSSRSCPTSKNFPSSANSSTSLADLLAGHWRACHSRSPPASTPISSSSTEEDFRRRVLHAPGRRPHAGAHQALQHPGGREPLNRRHRELVHDVRDPGTGADDAHRAGCRNRRSVHRSGSRRWGGGRQDIRRQRPPLTALVATSANNGAAMADSRYEWLDGPPTPQTKPRRSISSGR